MKKLLLLVFIICVILTACKSIPEHPEKISRGDYTYAVTYLDWIIREKMNEYSIPGLAAAVVCNDRVIFSRCYGYADIKKKIPVKGNTVFRAGSISKIFTAQAVLNLIEQGKIDPKADIQEYIPDFSLRFSGKKDKPITVKHLLSHTSGLLMDHYAGFTGEEIDSNSTLIKKLKDQPLCFTPGSAFKYSNIGYTLLGMIIEKVTGENFEAYVKKNVLNPFGMSRSSFKYQSSMKNNASLAYLGEKGNMVIPHLEIRDKPAAGLYTTLDDMTILLKRLTSNSTLADTMLSKIFSSEEKFDTFYDTKCRYSSGWHIDFYTFSGAKNILSGTGFINCFTSEIVILPDKKIGAIILTNSSLGWKAELEIMAKALKNFIDASAGVTEPRKTCKTIHVNDDIPESYDEYYGRYGSFGAIADIYGKEKKIYARIYDKKALFLPIGNNSFRPVIPLFFFNIDISRFSGFDQLLFRLYKNRKNNKFLLMEAMYGESKFSKVFHYIEKKPITNVFQKYQGTWYVMEDKSYKQMLKIYFPGKKLYLSEDDGWLTARFKSWSGEAQLLLKPLDENRVEIVGSGDTIFISEDSLDFLGLIFKK